MSLIISEINLKDKNKLINFLKKNHDYKLTKNQYKKLFETGWSKKENLGIVLKYNNQIVGFIGILYADNFFYKHTKTNILNIHTWVVNKKYRFLSLNLLNELNKLNCILIDHSSLYKLEKIKKRLGWKVLDKNFYLIPISIFNSKTQNFNFNYSKSNLLNKPFLDHQKHNCKYISFNNGKLELIFKIRKKKFLNIAEIVFISSKSFFNKNLSYVSKVLFKEFKIILIKLDERFLNNVNKITYKLNKLKYKNNLKLFRNNNKKLKIKKYLLSNLYSEFLLI